MIRTGSTLLAIALISASPLTAAAQSERTAPSEEAIAESRLHFDRGVQFYKEGSMDAALAEFTRAYELTRDHRLLFNLAQVQAERHDYARAIESLTEYLKQGGASVSAERRADVDEELVRLRQRIGELWVTANVPGEVWIGDRMVGRLPLKSPILVNAGSSSVRVTHPGYTPAVRQIDVTGGDRPRLDVRLEPMTASAPTASREPVRDNTWLWVSLTATGAFAAGSAVFGVLTARADDDLDDALATYPADAQRIEDARSTLRRDALLTDVFAGAALLAAGTSLYLYLNPSYERAATGGVSPKRYSARIVPSPTGLLVDGRF